jgi:hypothetical protein
MVSKSQKQNMPEFYNLCHSCVSRQENYRKSETIKVYCNAFVTFFWEGCFVMLRRSFYIRSDAAKQANTTDQFLEKVRYLKQKMLDLNRPAWNCTCHVLVILYIIIIQSKLEYHNECFATKCHFTWAKARNWFYCHPTLCRNPTVS